MKYKVQYNQQVTFYLHNNIGELGTHENKDVQKNLLPTVFRSSRLDIRKLLRSVNTPSKRLALSAGFRFGQNRNLSATL
jgi:hypothetical protein